MAPLSSPGRSLRRFRLAPLPTAASPLAPPLPHQRRFSLCSFSARGKAGFYRGREEQGNLEQNNLVCSTNDEQLVPVFLVMQGGAPILEDVAANVEEAKEEEMGRTSYIRIKHEEERREASSDWENPNGQVFSTTKDTDVAARLVELRNQILIGSASFADLALAPP
ncbi:hypothetical protein ZWY2020_009062 [Hordeum vulgare]|nr:hypothetical protein ZWY2020_009062 [Hordeum vulgare]